MPAQQTEMSDAALSLTEALALHQAGRLADAEKIYNLILAREPDHFDCLHLLGVISHQRGHHTEAVRQIDFALKRSPNNILALNNRGIALNELKRFEEALASYDRALAVQPDYAEALSNRGVALLALKRFDEALASCDRALALRPDYAEALLNRGNTLRELKRFAEALANYDRALARRPNYAEALSNRGNALKDLKRFEEALASYDRALAVRSDLPETLSNRGAALHELKRFEEALASCDRALALRPDFPEALANRGNALHALKRFEEAVESSDRAVALRPDFADAHYNRGNALYKLKRFEEALASYDREIVLRPDYAEAHANRGVTLQELRRFEEALASYDRALAVRPNFADAPYNEALCRLLIGDLRRGWEKHEWRWETEQLGHGKRNFSQKPWIGANEIAGKTILLHAEQGFGDTIQFCRYTPLVAERAARVILEVQKPLHELMGTLPGEAQIVSRGDPLPDFDLHCPLLSLPLAFGTQIATIPAQTPYLRAPSPAATHWNDRLGAKNRPRIGLAWSGRPTHKNDHNRSIALGSLLAVLAGVDATYVSLQREVRAGDAAGLQGRSDLLHFGDELKDFSDTAALMSNLDLIISVDTSVAHLAGALARPVWVMLPFMPDWRWLLDREDSPWYPTARLFRQDDTRRWDSVMARVHAALHDYVRSV
jgi:tetratricopeptide (TPR) repeat protein